MNRYLSELAEDLDTVDTVIKTGNVMADAILNSKLSVAEKLKIRLNVKAAIPEKLPLTDVELCAVMGNLLDNAVEACAALPEDERFMRVYIGKFKEQFYLSVQNSVGNVLMAFTMPLNWTIAPFMNKYAMDAITIPGKGAQNLLVLALLLLTGSLAETVISQCSLYNRSYGDSKCNLVFITKLLKKRITMDYQNMEYTSKYKGMIPTEKRDDNEYEFEFRQVSFKYPGSEQYVLRDINLTWRVGEKMALVGRNGSGKSTMVKLLCRLYDPTEGQITLNSVDIRKYDYEEYVALFSVVFQDSKLFSFSIAENVAADTEYDSALVEHSVRRAGLSRRLDDIVVLENGRISERGSHEKLLEKGGVYAVMWSAQAEYYKDTAGELFERNSFA